MPATIRIEGTVSGPSIDRTSAYSRDVEVPQHIVCVDCGGRCHLGGYEPEEGWQPGDVVFYRCEDCLDRWDIVLPDADDGRPDGP